MAGLLTEDLVDEFAKKGIDIFNLPRNILRGLQTTPVTLTGATFKHTIHPECIMEGGKNIFSAQHEELVYLNGSFNCKICGRESSLQKVVAVRSKDGKELCGGGLLCDQCAANFPPVRSQRAQICKVLGEHHKPMSPCITSDAQLIGMILHAMKRFDNVDIAELDAELIARRVGRKWLHLAKMSVIARRRMWYARLLDSAVKQLQLSANNDVLEHIANLACPKKLQERPKNI